jgi:hypothetical protein
VCFNTEKRISPKAKNIGSSTPHIQDGAMQEGPGSLESGGKGDWKQYQLK